MLNLPMTIDYGYIKRLDEEIKRLREEAQSYGKNTTDAYDRLFKLDKELDLFHLLFSYLVNSGTLNVGSYYKIFPMFDPDDKSYSRVFIDKGRFTLKQDFEGIRVVDRYNEFSNL